MPGAVYRKQGMSKGGNTARLGGIYGACRGRAAFTGWQGNLHNAGADNRAGVRGREGKTWNAVHINARVEKAEVKGFAYFRVYEFEKAGELETEKRANSTAFLSNQKMAETFS